MSGRGDSRLTSPTGDASYLRGRNGENEGNSDSDSSSDDGENSPRCFSTYNPNRQNDLETHQLNRGLAIDSHARFMDKLNIPVTENNAVGYTQQDHNKLKALESKIFPLQQTESVTFYNAWSVASNQERHKTVLQESASAREKRKAIENSQEYKDLKSKFHQYQQWKSTSQPS